MRTSRRALTGLTRPTRLLAGLSAAALGLSLVATTPLAARADETPGSGLIADIGGDLEGAGDPAAQKALAARDWPGVGADGAVGTRSLAADDEVGSGYGIVDLTDNQRSNASGINEAGEVSGTIFTDAGNFPYVWRDGTLVRLDAPVEQPSTIVRAMAIGDDGTVGGWQVSWMDNARFAVGWTKQSNGSYGPMQRITKVWHGEENALYGGEAKAVAADGATLVTEPKDSVADPQADIVYDHGSVRELMPAPAEPFAFLGTNDMNDAEVVVGHTAVQNSRYTAASWQGAAPSLLPDSPWSTPDTVSTAIAINNDRDTVVGVTGGGVQKFGLRRADGSWVDLGSLGSTGEFSNLEPWDVNDKDVVVGAAWVTVDGVSSRHAFLWRDGQAIDLNAYLPSYTGWELTAAHSINEKGQIVGIGWHRGVESAFLLDPTAPMLFVPGAGASVLKAYDQDPGDPEEIWLGCTKSRLKLSLFPEDNAPTDVRAVDAARHMSCFGLGGSVIEDLDGYGTFLDAMTQRFGYREYQVDEKVERRTTVGCDTSQRDQAPNLFVFAYDWRKDNRLAAQQLEDYIGCIRKFFPDTDIDVVTHSMGSLVARRYVLNNVEDHHIHRMVTIGAPWLGAPKLVDVLNTGNFASPIAAGADVQHVATGFTAAHELMAGPYYHRFMGPVFVEDGWDYNGRSGAHEAYSWPTLHDALNTRFPRTRPAETAQVFQEDGGSAGQADWSQDASGIPYTHIYGVRSGQDTIGQVVAVEEVSCTPLVRLSCETERYVTQRMTRGDGTVPMRSASRIGPEGEDLNAPTSRLFPIIEEDETFDQGVEHTGLTRNETVLQKVISTLRADDEEQTTGLTATASAGPTVGAVPAAASYRYVTVHGARDIVVHDGKGRDDAILGADFRPALRGVQHLAQGADAELVTMPAEVSHDWRLSFTGAGRPLSLTALEGTQTKPTTAVRWRDVVVPEGHKAELLLTPTGLERLRVDTDGDGGLDTTVQPTADLAGDNALDVTAPAVDVSATTVSGQRRYVVGGTDEGTGVRRLLWSTDGESFAPYAAPVDAGTATTLHAFAEDWAGNRSPVATLDLATAPEGPVTTASSAPEPSDRGWSAGPVTVRLTALAGDSSPVAGIRVKSSGAQPTDESVTAGATTTVDVVEPGTTTLSYRAEAADGATEPWRQLTVRIDASAPAGRLVAPAAGAVLSTIQQISGTAADDAAGVAGVKASLQRTSDGAFWDGDSWEPAVTWLPARGTATWKVTATPGADKFLPGGYAVRARVTDGADRTTVTPARTFVKAYDAPAKATALLPMTGVMAHTSAVGLNDRGLVAGVVGTIPSRGALWSGQLPKPVSAPEGIKDTTVLAVAADGSSAGEARDHDSGYRTWGLRWAVDGTVHTLPDAAGQVFTSARGISAAGVVGQSGNSAVWWPDDETVKVLPTLHDGESAGATDIDGTGTIVGWVASPAGVYQAVVWTDGGRKVAPLGDIGGVGSQALAINEVGQAVGWARDEQGRTRPFIADVHEADGMLDVYVPGFWGEAIGVNDDGTVVGEYEPVPDVSAAFMVKDGTFYKLNSTLKVGSGWDLVRARSINNLGQIVGFGMLNGVGRAFIYSATHAPSAGDVEAVTDVDTTVPVTLDGVDPDPDSTLTYEILTQPGHGSLGSATTGTVGYTPAAGWAGTDTFTYRVKDETGLWSNTATVEIAVRAGSPTNQKPVAAINAPATLPEGSTVHLDGSASADADGTVAAYSWDLDEDGDYDDATGATAQLDVPQQGTRVVGLQVVDDDGAESTAVASVVVTNVAPQVDLPATSTVQAGAPWVAAGSFADPGADSWSATVDTGGGKQSLALDGRGFTVSTSFPVAGTSTATVEVCDGTGCGSATTTVTVTPRPNKAPSAIITAPASAAEGSQVQLDGSASSDQDGSVATYAWDLDADGDYDDASGSTATMTPAQQGERTVGLRVVDDGGAAATVSRAIDVTNVVPTVSATGSATAVVGQPWSLTGSFTDPGADTWAATVDLGDGLGAKPAAVTGRSLAATGTFLVVGTRLVTVTVCDGTECGGATLAVTVTAAPTAAWPWDGFFSPVDNLPVVNTVKAGQAIPLKFSVGGYRGTEIFTAGFPKSVSHTCGSTAATDAVEETVSPGSSELSYDAGTGRYQYVWKTQKPWGGQCRTLVIQLADGSVHTAEFLFR